jgi:hypothetical protein
MTLLAAGVNRLMKRARWSAGSAEIALAIASSIQPSDQY